MALKNFPLIYCPGRACFRSMRQKKSLIYCPGRQCFEGISKKSLSQILSWGKPFFRLGHKKDDSLHKKAWEKLFWGYPKKRFLIYCRGRGCLSGVRQKNSHILSAERPKKGYPPEKSSPLQSMENVNFVQIAQNGFSEKVAWKRQNSDFWGRILLHSTDRNVTVAFMKRHSWKMKSKQFQWVMAIMCDTSQEEVWHNVFKIDGDVGICNKVLNIACLAA